MVRPVPAACLNLIHEFEGNAGQPELTPVQDPAGNWEIGWSHKLTDPSAMPLITPAQADALANGDLLNAAVKATMSLNDSTVWGLTEGQWAAVIDFVYNEGAAAFDGSTFCRLIRYGMYARAADELDLWVYAHVDGKAVKEPGLVRRRAAEKQLFLA